MGMGERKVEMSKGSDVFDAVSYSPGSDCLHRF